MHRGRHLALGTEVCIKELKDIFGYFSFLQRGEVLKRLKRELCAQAQVRHPAVVAIIDQAIEGARPYVVMELLSGSLRDRLERAGGKSLPVAAVDPHLPPAVLCAARRARLRADPPQPQAGERALRRLRQREARRLRALSRVIEVEPGKGMPQVFVGTGSLSYLAPELITRKDAGPAADVYGLGILLYEMLTGGIPGRRSPLPSEVNSEVPSKLDPIFDKMTQDRRESRYPDFDAMLDEFYGAFSDGEFLHRGDLVLSSEPPGAPEPSRRTMTGADPELLSGARLLSTGTWRASHEAFETAWRRSEGHGRDLLQALAQLAAALLKWSEGRLEPAGTLLGRVRRRLEGLPSRVVAGGGGHARVHGARASGRLALREPAPRHRSAAARGSGASPRRTGWPLGAPARTAASG